MVLALVATQPTVVCRRIIGVSLLRNLGIVLHPATLEDATGLKSWTMGISVIPGGRNLGFRASRGNLAPVILNIDVIASTLSYVIVIDVIVEILHIKQCIARRYQSHLPAFGAVPPNPPPGGEGWVSRFSGQVDLAHMALS